MSLEPQKPNATNIDLSFSVFDPSSSYAEPICLTSHFETYSTGGFFFTDTPLKS